MKTSIPWTLTDVFVCIAVASIHAHQKSRSSPLAIPLEPIADIIDAGAVSRIFASWNQVDGWLRQVEGLRRVA